MATINDNMATDSWGARTGLLARRASLEELEKGMKKDSIEAVASFVDAACKDPGDVVTISNEALA